MKNISKINLNNTIIDDIDSTSTFEPDLLNIPPTAESLKNYLNIISDDTVKPLHLFKTSGIEITSLENVTIYPGITTTIYINSDNHTNNLLIILDEYSIDKIYHFTIITNFSTGLNNVNISFNINDIIWDNDLIPLESNNNYVLSVSSKFGTFIII